MPIIARSTVHPEMKDPCILSNIPTFKLPSGLTIKGSAVVPGFNVPLTSGLYNSHQLDVDDQKLFWNYENDEYELYSSDADAAGCYGQEDSSEQEEGEDDDDSQEEEGDEDDEFLYCENSINCPHHCHCDGPGYVCFCCRLVALQIKVEMPRAISLPPKPSLEDTTLLDEKKDSQSLP
jgi:hypothetical protein